jgi:hypothetical protein
MKTFFAWVGNHLADILEELCFNQANFVAFFLASGPLFGSHIIHTQCQCF